MLENWLDLWRKMGAIPEVKDAPAGAVTFDKMIIVFRDPSDESIIKVQFFDSKSGKIVGSF